MAQPGRHKEAADHAYGNGKQKPLSAVAHHAVEGVADQKVRNQRGNAGGFGNDVFLMNFGVFGLFILGYYNLVGASFNGATFGVMFCMLSTCNSGSHPLNAWPMLLGYMVASPLMHWLSRFFVKVLTPQVSSGATIRSVPSASSSFARAIP